MTTITLNADHALVLATVCGFHLTNMILGGMIGGARKAYKVEYPNLYASPGLYLTEDGKIDVKKWEANGNEFNRRQRGHQHMCETSPDAYALMLTCGLFYPKYAAGWGVMWIIGTIGYYIGYSIAPKYRIAGELLYMPAVYAWAYGLYCAGKALHYGTPL